MSFVVVKGVSAGYGKGNIIENVSFELDRGTVMGVIGANGSGKTTLLKSICGILPHWGSCVVDGKKLEDLKPKRLSGIVGYIPQRSGISIDISVFDVVLMGFNSRLGLLEHPTKQMRSRAMEALAQVGLSGREEENYLKLSEGQKQLCILARTLVSDGRLLLLDEPESALDFRFRHRMMGLMTKFVKDGERSAVVSLHDPYLALNFCDRLLLLSGGGVSGIIEPKKDPLEDMQQKLGAIYGPVSLQRCINGRGDPVVVMLGEE